MVTYIKSDLEFILQQIKLSEAHAAGQPLFGPGGLIPAPDLSWGVRTVDGSFNHLLPGQEKWGAADQPFLPLVTPSFRTVMVDPDGPGPSPAVPMSYVPGTDNPGPYGPGTVLDPSVRTISNLIVDQTPSNPAAIVEALKRNGVAGDQATHYSIAVEIKAEFDQIKPLFRAVEVAADEYAEAKAAAGAADPPNPNLDAAAAAALAQLQAAQAELQEARGPLDALLEPNGIELIGANVQLDNVAPDGASAPFNAWFTLFGQFFDHGLDFVNKGGSGTVFIPLARDDPLYDPDLDGADNIAGNADDPKNFMVLTRATVSAGPDGIWNTADDGRPVNTTTSFVDQNQTYASHASHQVFLREYTLVDGRPEATGRLIDGHNGGMANWGELKDYARTHLGIQLLDSDVGKVPLLRTDPYGNFIPGANGFPQVVIGLGADGTPNTADDVVVEGNPAANGGKGISIANAIRTGHAFLGDIAHNAVPAGLADGDIEVGLSNGDGTQTDGFYDDELLEAHFIAGDGRVNENIGLTAVHHVFHAEHNRLLEHTKEVVLASADLAFINEWLDAPISALPADLSTLNWNGERLFQAAKFGNEMQYQHLVFEEFARKARPGVGEFGGPSGFDTNIDPSIVAEFAHVVYRFGHSMLSQAIDRYDSGFDAGQISLIRGFLNPIEYDAGGSLTDQIAAGDIIRGMTRQTGMEIDEFVTTALRNNLLGLPLDLATINLARGRDVGAPTLNQARRQFFEATNDSDLKPYESWTDFAGNLNNEGSVINFIAAYGTHSLIRGQNTAEGKRDAALTIISGQSVNGLAVPSDRLDFLNGRGAYGAATGLGGVEHIDLWIGGLAERKNDESMLGSTFGFVFQMQLENLQNGDRFYYLQRLDGLHFFEQLEGNTFAAIMERATNATHLPSDVFSTPDLILEVDRSKQFNDLDGDGDLESGDPQGSVIRDNPATSGPDSNYLRYVGDYHVVLGGSAKADTLIAGDGDDTLHGDGGNDRLEGNGGSDLINGGAGNDIITDAGGDDNIKAGDGNDAVRSGPGADLVLGGRGQDFVVLGSDEGSEVFGGEGDDFILGHDNAELIFGNEGHDWLEAGAAAGAAGDNLDGISEKDAVDGNDVFVGNGGPDYFIGEGGDDIMVAGSGANSMRGMSGFDWATFKNRSGGVTASLSTPNGTAAFETVEGLSGTRFNDTLTGSDVTSATIGAAGFRGSALDAQGIAAINGLQTLLGAGVTSFGAGDILLGGDGSDLITGRAGNDIIDGDRWLNVRISVRENSDGTGREIGSANSMGELQSRIFNGTVNPGQLVIVREIKVANGANDTDIAVFSGARGEYDISYGKDGTVTIAHVRGTGADGTDTLRNIERARFSDSEIALNGNGLVGVTWSGTAGSNIFDGTAGNDIADGRNGNDTLNGNGGNDALNGGSGNDRLNGGQGDDRLDGGQGADTAVFARAAADYSLDGTGRSVRITDKRGGEGSDTLENVETLRFAGTDYAVVTGTPGNNKLDKIKDLDGRQAMFGMAGNDTINGGGGNDLIHGGEGADRISQDAQSGGRDRVDGGSGEDIYQLLGGSGAETFRIYSRDAAQAAGLTGLSADTEIVVTRNGTTNAAIIAELDDIEQILINSARVLANGSSGSDTFQLIGDFGGTSLRLDSTASASAASAATPAARGFIHFSDRISMSPFDEAMELLLQRSWQGDYLT